MEEMKRTLPADPNEKTRELLRRHLRRYPLLQIQDVFKFLHQSTFGCEHMVTSLEAATSFIQKERAEIPPQIGALPEELDGAYSRVPLFFPDPCLSAETLGKLFVASSRKEKESVEDLIRRLKEARRMVLDKELPFSPEEWDSAERNWAEKAYPALHHSPQFRSAYHPAYRVIHNRYLPLLPLLAELEELSLPSKEMPLPPR